MSDAPNPVTLHDLLKMKESEKEQRRSQGSRREAIEIAPGDTVFHDRFGEGVVVTVSGRGGDTEATIAFEDVGEKRVLLAYAPLSKG